MIYKPKRSGQYVDREVDCEEAMDYALRDVIDRANAAGWGTQEVIDAMSRALPNIQIAYGEDPDPAEDIAERDSLMVG